MSAKSAHLVLSPEKCDRCGHCVPACPSGLVRVAGGYISVETSACDGCGLCVEVCERGAIVRKMSAGRAGSHGPVVSRADVGRVAVGSRAEAQALREAAKAAEKERTKPPRKFPAATAGAAEDPGPVAWGDLDAFAVLAVLTLTFAGKEAALGSAAFVAMPQVGQVAGRGLVLGVFYALQLGALAFLAHRHAATLPGAFGLGPRRGGAVGAVAGRAAGSALLVVGLLVATRVFATAWGAAAQAAGWDPPARGIAELTAVFGAGGAGLALSVLMVVIVGPLTEELLFRGVLLGAAGARWGMWPAVLMSSAVFALYHVTPWLFVPTLILGIALGWLAWTRRSLWPAIVLHMLYNGVAVGAAFWLAR